MISSSHAIINLTVYEGATFYREFTWQTGDPAAPVDLYGVTARMQARDNIEDDEPVLDLTTANGGVIILSPTSAGKYAISLTPRQTAGLCTDHTKRVLVYDLLLDHGEDDTGYQQKGKITINPAVTRGD